CRNAPEAVRRFRKCRCPGRILCTARADRWPNSGRSRNDGVPRPLSGRRDRGVGFRDARRCSETQELRRPVRGSALGGASDPRHRDLPAQSILCGHSEFLNDGWRDRADHLQRCRLSIIDQGTHAGTAGDDGVDRGVAVRCFRLVVHRGNPEMMTPIHISPSSLREGRWYEYVIRFALGGAATVFTGIVSGRYGASVGGLFLALPAIFCASATLIEKHEIRRKREAGLSGERRGQEAAALAAAGTALGALGMLAFAGVFLWLVERSVAAAFAAASLAWIVVSAAAWFVRRKLRFARRVVRETNGSAMPRRRSF